MSSSRIRLLLIGLLVIGAGIGLTIALGGFGGGGGGNVPVPPKIDEEPGSASPTGPAWMKDVTPETGIAFTYRNGEEANHFAIIESLGGGVGLIDYDRDGLLDIFVPAGGYYEGKNVLGHPSKLYRNLGGFKFQDVSTAVGLDAVKWHYSHGAACFDYDNDGFTDILVTGYNRLILLHNEADGTGGRKFFDATPKSGLNEQLWSTSAAWGDLDGDGFADLYVAHYGNWGFGGTGPDGKPYRHPEDCTYDGKTRDVCQPKRFEALPHSVYKNNGNGTFTDMSKLFIAKNGGKGIGVVIADLNADGKPDVYVANDTDDNYLWFNKRTKVGEWAFEEVALLANCARDDRGTPNGSMGIDISDYDRSGRGSIIVSNYEQELPALYNNRATAERMSFNYATVVSGIGKIGGIYVNWGIGFLDADRDGWDDLAIFNGHAIRYPAAKFGRQQAALLLRNQKGKFSQTVGQGGTYFDAKHNARGAALGDLDNDGKVEAVVSHLNEPLAVLKNVTADENHWIGLELAPKGNRSFVGAKVIVESANGTNTRYQKGGASYGSTADPRHVVGLGAAKTASVKVVWPDGATEEWKDLASGGYWRLSEGMPGQAEKRK
ncbi:MAG: CRTAC1 family protein [Gemmataceae bacterium]|nr:CRTAC1 family protein [Gemmataceae bacterium]